MSSRDRFDKLLGALIDVNYCLRSQNTIHKMMLTLIH
jgi:hypothetical protein